MAAKTVHSMIRVFNEKRALDFYASAFGLKPVDRLGFDGFALVYLRNAASPFELELTVNFDRREPYELGDGYGHLAVTVDSVDAEHARLEKAGLSPGVAVGNPIRLASGPNRAMKSIHAGPAQSDQVVAPRPGSIETIARGREFSSASSADSAASERAQTPHPTQF
jgi:lactoylglutathione lyase